MASTRPFRTSERPRAIKKSFPLPPLPSTSAPRRLGDAVLRPGDAVAMGTPAEFRGRWAPNGAPNIAPRYDNGMQQQVNPVNLEGISQHLSTLMQHPQGAAMFKQFVAMFQNHQAEAARRRQPAWGSRI